MSSDDFSRECLATVVDISLSGERVVRELERLVQERCAPRTIQRQSLELISVVILRWAAERLEWHYIQPGKPIQNAFIESFNSSATSVTPMEFVVQQGDEPPEQTQGSATHPLASPPIWHFRQPTLLPT